MDLSIRATRKHAAAKAIEYARKKLFRGSSNKDNSSKDAYSAVTEGRIFLAGGTGGPFNAAKLLQLANHFLQIQGGNCGETAAVAFKYLFETGIFPLEYVSSTRSDHAWLVIGRPADDDDYDAFYVKGQVRVEKLTRSAESPY